MPAQPVPAGYHTITPYLVVKDGAQQLEFLKAAFAADLKQISKGPDGSIMHATLQIGDSMLMLGSSRGPWQPQPCSLYLYVPNVDELYQQAKNAGAESVIEPRNEFYGDRMAGVRDSSGNTWWIATHIEDVSEAEMQIRQQKLFGKPPQS